MCLFFFFLKRLSRSLSVGAGADMPSKHPRMSGWSELPLLEGCLKEHILPQLLFQYLLSTMRGMGENTPRKAGMRTSTCD